MTAPLLNPSDKHYCCCRKPMAPTDADLPRGMVAYSIEAYSIYRTHWVHCRCSFFHSPLHLAQLGAAFCFYPIEHYRDSVHALLQDIHFQVCGCNFQHSFVSLSPPNPYLNQPCQVCHIIISPSCLVPLMHPICFCHHHCLFNTPSAQLFLHMSAGNWLLLSAGMHQH